MTLGDYIKEYRSIHKCSMEDFAKRAGLSKAYVSILERNNNPSTGKAAIPSLETIKRVAAATAIDFNDLISMLDENQEVFIGTENKVIPMPEGCTPMPEMKKLPLIGAIACGQPILAEEHIEDYVDVPKYIDADFALTCKGDSMINARIFDGDIVYIRQQETVENGEIAAVMVGDGEATLKRFHRYEDHVTLEPENPMHRPMAFWNEEMNNVRILGKAVAFTSAVR